MTLDNGRSQDPAPSTALVPIATGETALARQDQTELARAARFAAASKSDATKRAYVSDFTTFVGWCTERELDPLPAANESVSRYLADLADRGKKVSTIRRALAAITYAHRLKGYEPPGGEALKAVMAGIRRELGVKPERKAPVTVDVVKKMIRLVPGTLIGARDRALLLTGFAGAFRRSELVALQVEDIERRNEGLLITIRRSKTDQEGEGREVAIPRGGKLQTAEAIDAWIGAARITSGPLFRSVDRHGRVGDKLSDQAVADIVKRYAVRAGLDPSLFAGHSLRAGFVTSAMDSGADAMRIMDVTGHKDVRTLRVYDRRTKFQKHAGRSFL